MQKMPTYAVNQIVLACITGILHKYMRAEGPVFRSIMLRPH